uniref:non-specific serine/threonine protein kinase n=1 Tax=Anabas testudineus TaxID=64144 RepID=A0A3Q1IBS2_ANATE
MMAGLGVLRGRPVLRKIPYKKRERSPRSEFKAKYTQQNQLGKGGCGCVFAGYRNADNLPVRVTHLSNTFQKTRCSELILVLERPVPSEDLFNYIEINGAVELHNKCIFHRDIKVENILIQTGADVPRVRLIDFGLSCFFKKTSSYRVFYGTLAHVPPEWYSCYSYKAGPTTVWQLGVVLFEMLHPEESFETTNKTIRGRESSPSHSCQDFLQMCLTKVPEQRPTLEQLHLHPWLR